MQVYDNIAIEDVLMLPTKTLQNYLFSVDNYLPKVKKEFSSICGRKITVFTQEFWTSKQRQASSIHEISYRACFKPQLPSYFITRLSKPGDVVYDPFSGRGTTVIEAALLGRNIIANDANPLSAILSRPRINPPTIKEVESRFNTIPYKKGLKADIDLSMFYHPDTESELVSLRNYLIARKKNKKEDFIDEWIRMVATNRLTGHSTGFFSVYTLPPNQAITPQKQIKINKTLNQFPPYRNTKEIIQKKTIQLTLRLSPEEIINLKRASENAIFLSDDARKTASIPDSSVKVTVTSPPFLDIVQYNEDNWLRCWFNNIGVDIGAPKITMEKTVEKWAQVMLGALTELYRITKKGGWVAFEVGEVRNGKIKLDEHIVPLGFEAGFTCEAVLINEQKFTKTANIWGVKNNISGTNSNRIVLFQKA